ncbi:MAG: AAA family ATPase [Methanosarcinales archaeon]|uniref:AAA family ATPase n=1 Tax=Candidatus Ethanoperedens thermophilum TaxID=2766897 RepID=A0A848DA51_9EURY|nr:AAA family ATPase [Candidatus Ethanoperedens thermophilum]
MNIIKNVEIVNYKGIEKTQFSCGSINIIVGPNNTGKSSILESVWMAVASLNDFEDNLETRLSDIIETENIRHLIHQGKQKSTIALEIFENDRIILDLLYSKKNYPEEVAEFFLTFINKTPKFDEFETDFHMSLLELQVLGIKLDRLSGKAGLKEELDKLLKRVSENIESVIEDYRSRLIKSEKVFLTSKINNNLISIRAVMDGYADGISIFNEESPSIQKIPLIISSPHIDEDVSEIYKKLVNTKKLAEVLEILKNKIPYFEDIREVDGDLLVLLENLDEPLPLSFMGDGFKALLKLSFMAPLIKNGIALFEEPETSMHPGYLNILAKEILLSSEYSQIFISTHSLELIEYLLEKAEKSGKIESIKILKLRRLTEGYIEREIFSGKEAAEEIEVIKTDLRGF